MTRTPSYKELLDDIAEFQRMYHDLNKATPTTMRVSRNIGNRRFRHMFSSVARNLGLTIVWFDHPTYQGGRME